MTKIKVGILGPSGRMGKSLLEQIKNFKELQLSSLCEKKSHPMIGKKIDGVTVQKDLKNFVDQSQVIIDFSIPDATLCLMNQIKKSNIKTALVTGTTGYTNNQEKKFLKFSNGLKILRSFNMSIGITILKNLVTITSKNFSDNCDVEISEIHHKMKRDIPSGTAISLANSINQGLDKPKKFNYRKQSSSLIKKKNEIGFTSIRGGDTVGEHTVFFFMDGERIELSHRASDRKIFSNGALNAAKWLFNKKPGVYSLLDMLN